MTFFLVDANSINSSGTPEPIIAIAFLIPYFNRFLTSFRPSTMIIPSLFFTLGPAVIPLRFTSVSTVRTDLTSSRIFLDSSAPEPIRSINRRLALSITTSLFADTTFSILCTLMDALQGPILSMVSSDAPITEVET